MDYTLKKMKGLKEIEIYNPPLKKTSGILSFNIKGAHSHDVASLLDEDDICVRAGHHCTMPLMKSLKIPQNGTARISFYFYNSFEDIDKLIESLKKIIKRFNKK